MKFKHTYNTRIGLVEICADEKSLLEISFGSGGGPGIPEVETPLIRKAREQLDEYFEGNRQTFDLPISLEGTVFQQQVWNALMEIPYGETRSYKDIAVAIGNPKAVRAVGMANNKNKIPVIIPCHRVIGSNGSLVGYAGGLDVKAQLLALEKNE